jgi:vanillate O-demethylase ferredoxin subunit
MLRVAAMAQETPDILAFDLCDPEGSAMLCFTAGSHIDVEVAPGMVRQYSLLNAPIERHRYRIGVLKDPKSRGGSVAMHAVKPGDLIRIAGPRNHFELALGDHPTLLLAGGIGVTPLLSMAQHLHQNGKAFSLHYCARSRAQAAFLSDLQSSPYTQNVRTHFDDETPEQRLDIKSVLSALAPETQIYVCGPPGFMGWCIEAAIDAGIPEPSIHREYFNAPAAPSDGQDIAFQVAIASSGSVYDVPAGLSILHVLRDHGIAVPASCETGVCGTCLTGILSGIPDHRDCYLSKQERAANDVMLPCCSRAKSPRLVLDL